MTQPKILSGRFDLAVVADIVELAVAFWTSAVATACCCKCSRARKMSTVGASTVAARVNDCVAKGLSVIQATPIPISATTLKTVSTM